jgi:hypothetical protein
MLHISIHPCIEKTNKGKNKTDGRTKHKMKVEN